MPATRRSSHAGTRVSCARNRDSQAAVRDLSATKCGMHAVFRDLSATNGGTHATVRDPSATNHGMHATSRDSSVAYRGSLGFGRALLARNCARKVRRLPSSATNRLPVDAARVPWALYGRRGATRRVLCASSRFSRALGRVLSALRRPQWLCILAGESLFTDPPSEASVASDSPRSASSLSGVATRRPSPAGVRSPCRRPGRGDPSRGRPRPRGRPRG